MKSNTCPVAVLWKHAPNAAAVAVRDGTLGRVKWQKRAARPGANRARPAPPAPGRLRIECRGARVQPGSPATVVSVKTPSCGFSFFLRDVSAACPIFLPDLGAAVVPAEDPRGYEQVAADVASRRRLTKLEQIESEPEENYEAAAAHTRRLEGLAVLGLGRDMRLFTASPLRSPNGMPWESVVEITPRQASRPLIVPETAPSAAGYRLTVGRGMGCVLPLTRRLDDGALPILHQRVTDDEVLYDLTLFCSLERAPLGPGSVRGTHFLVADGYTGGHVFTPDQQTAFWRLLACESSQSAEDAWASARLYPSKKVFLTDSDRARFMKAYRAAAHRLEEPVLVCRVEARNTAAVPRYAWLGAPAPVNGMPMARAGGLLGYEPESGFGLFESGTVFCVARLNGKPMPHAEVSVLLPPGGGIEAEFLIPHRPIDRARAARLARQPVPAHLEACRRFWRATLDRDARIDIPEPRLRDRVRACRLHLDLVMYGREPAGPLAPSCGLTYSALAPENAAMIQFLDSVGRHDLVRRALDFFLEKQHPDGMMRNHTNFQTEPGAVLWMVAEHVRYTRDTAWLRRRAARLLKTADYLLAWRARNRRPDLRGRGYGLIDGQSADMRETFYGFNLNAGAVHGIQALADALRGVLPADSRRLSREALAWKRDLRAAVMHSMERAPVVPLGDGAWTPSLAPWPERDRPACLDDRQVRDSHGTTLIRDDAFPAALIFHGLFEPDEPCATRLMRYVTDLYHVRNVRHSQPYISWHPWVHLRRGEVKPFLKSYYNTLASLADRDIYAFWEHYFGACPLKTEADGAFLMLTRWMLWVEAGRTLTCLAGAPRAWLADGREIRLERVASYFGPLSLRAASRGGARALEAEYRFFEPRRPAELRIRLPHPDGIRPHTAAGGRYDAASETVVVSRPGSSGTVRLDF